MLPSTVDRVPKHTSEAINEQIRRQIEECVVRYQNASDDEIQERLEELDREWDIERLLEANAATACLVGLTLGATVDRKWFLFPGGRCGIPAPARSSRLVSAVACFSSHGRANGFGN